MRVEDQDLPLRLGFAASIALARAPVVDHGLCRGSAIGKGPGITGILQDLIDPVAGSDGFHLQGLGIHTAEVEGEMVANRHGAGHTLVPGGRGGRPPDGDQGAEGHGYC